MRKIKSDVILKKGPYGWEAWQTNKLIAKVSGFSEESKEEVMKHIPGYENVIESSKQIKSAKSEDEFNEAVAAIADYFMVNADGNNIPVGREITDIDYENGLDDIFRKYNVSLRPSKFNDRNYIVVNNMIVKNSRQIKPGLYVRRTAYEPYWIGGEGTWSQKESLEDAVKDGLKPLGYGYSDLHMLYNDGVYISDDEIYSDEKYQGKFSEIFNSRQIKSSYNSWEDFYQKGCKLGLKDYMNKLDILHDKYGKFDRVPKDKLSTLVNDIPTDTEERNNFVDDMFDYFDFGTILSSKQIKSAAYSVHYSKTNDMHDSLEDFAKAHNVENWSSVGPAWTSFDWNGHHFYIEIHYEKDRFGEWGAVAEISVDKGPKDYTWDVVDYFEENWLPRNHERQEQPKNSEPLFYVKNSRSQANLEGYNCGHKGGGDITDNPYNSNTENEDWNDWRAGFSEGEHDRIHSSRQIKSARISFVNEENGNRVNTWFNGKDLYEVDEMNQDNTDRVYLMEKYTLDDLKHLGYKMMDDYEQIESRFNQMNTFNKYTLSEVAQYLSALFFDLRTIHFKTTGNDFLTYHELAQELYEQTEEYYDDIIETAISFDNNTSPMYVLPGDWNFVDENNSLSTDGQFVQNLILDKLKAIYDVLENVKEYDSMVQSKIDSMLEYYDKEIYKLGQVVDKSIF